ncbi:MAG: diacylglycerol kinase family protein [Gemmatimonadaceae bacterium]
MTHSAGKIPALMNSASGTADAARDALSANDAFELNEVAPDKLEDALRTLVGDAVPRLLVAGGDGTIATAASALLKTEIELAILPGGTLNHFASDLQIPSKAEDALALAVDGTSKPADVGMVNKRVFLNTSSAGTYVHFVRVREYLEPRFGYRIASFIAALRVLFTFRTISVEFEVDGQRKSYVTPMIFIGAGERELKLPLLGKRIPGGKRGLHVMIVKGRTPARLMAIGLNAVARGVKTAARTPELDSFIVERCTITLRHEGRIAVDGELVSLGTTLDYHIDRDAIKVVCP